MTWQEAWQAGLQGLRRTWETSKVHSVTMALSAVLVAMVPAGLALLSGYIVTDVEALLKTDDPAFSAVLPWLLLSAGLLSAIGLGTRSQRFAMIVDNGVVQSLDIEPGREVTVSGAAACLARLD